MSYKQTSVLRLLAQRAPQTHCLPVHHAFVRAQSSITTRQWSTQLAKRLAEVIATTGPIPIAQFMRQCLTSDLGGYYTPQDESLSIADMFGKKGDFITSPEISQIFGELVGIWFVTEWMAQGRKSTGVQLLELGSGRGTLMDDALRTIAKFKPMASAIDIIYLVEASATLREAQRKTLCGDAKMEEHPAGFQSTCRHIPGVKVVWVEDLKFIPREHNKQPFIIAHEFFDALPIHTFQSVLSYPAAAKPASNSTQPPNTDIIDTTTSTPSPPSPTNDQDPKNTWRELVVSPTKPPSIIHPPKTPGPEFELTVSPTSTPRSRTLPQISTRYQHILQRIGATIEICPEARVITTALTELIAGTRSTKPRTLPDAQIRGRTKGAASGAALIVDYGPAETVPINTLRGIRQHEMVSPFSSPGLVDVSADVDFGSLVETALESSEAIEVHGPVLQGEWLEAMGGGARQEALLRAARKAEAEGKEGAREVDGVDGGSVGERIETGWKRLVDRGPNGMGRLYKVLAIVPERGGRRPVGFGGGVE